MLRASLAVLLVATAVAPGSGGRASAGPIGVSVSACGAAAGAVSAWGDNRFGQLGDGTTSPRDVPVGPFGLGVLGAGVVQVAAGYSHSLARLADGSVVAWGDNTYGQLGDGTTAERDAPVRVLLPGPVREVAAGGDNTQGSPFSLAVMRDGSVYAWGGDFSGQLGVKAGVGMLSPSPVPAALPGLSGVTSVAAGVRHALAIGAGGSLYAWGDNAAGELGSGSTSDTPSPTPARVGGLTVKAVAAGAGYSLAVDATIEGNGAVWAWGDNSEGQLGDGTSTPSARPEAVAGVSGVTAVAASSAKQSVALDGKGMVWVWGLSEKVPGLGSGNPPVPLPGLASASAGSGPVKAIAASGADGSSGFGMAVTGDGSVWSWGNDVPGGGGTAPTKVSGVDHVASVAAGGQFALAVRDRGSAFLSPCAGTSPQAAPVGQVFKQPLWVLVRNDDGTPAPGVSVTFTAPSSGASGRFDTVTGPAVAVTGTSGTDGVVVAPTFTADTTAGSYQVTATVAAGGFEGVSFALTNTPGGLSALMAVDGATPQQARVMTAFAQPLAVRAADIDGNGLAGVAVTFTAPSSGASGTLFVAGQSSGTATVATGPDGVASAQFTANAVVGGPYSVEARVAVPGVGPVDFSLTNSAGPTPVLVTVVAGDNQSSEVGQRLAAPLAVRVFADLAGSVPAPGAQVTFKGPASGAGLTFAGGGTSVTVTSDDTGVASTGATPPTANAVVGKYTVTVVAAGGAQASFSLTNIAQPAPAVTALSPSSGPAWGGTEVMVTGTGFGGLSPVGSVRFGSVAAASFQVISATRLTAVSPTAPPGPVQVTVVLANQAESASGTGDDVFTSFAGGWHPAGALTLARVGPTATVLIDGTVLMVGGEGNPNHVCMPGEPGARSSDAAEVYDPVTATSSTALHMGFGRVDHSATRFADGRVLVVGGCSAEQALASAEIFDPVAGTWTGAANLTHARSGHAATLLADGRVLVVGGNDGPGAALTSTEIFNPDVATPGRAVTATVTDRSATVSAPSGSFSPADVGRSVTAAPGTGVGSGVITAVPDSGSFTMSSTATATGSVGLVLGPLVGSWTPVAPLPEARVGFSATLLDGPACHPVSVFQPAWCGRVLVAGGVGATGLGSDTYVLFDPAAGQWIAPTDRMTAPRYGQSSTAVGDGTVMVAGGCCTSTVPQGALGSAEVYDPTLNGVGGWTAAGSMTDARFDHLATRLSDGTVMVAGGTADVGSTQNGPLASTERYDPTTKRWAARGALLTPRTRSGAAALAVGGKTLVAGGADTDGRPLTSVELFDPAAPQPRPVLTRIAPPAGTAGTRVTVTGTGFFSAATVVNFDTVPALHTELVTDTEVVVDAPAQPRGTVHLTVTRADGMSSPPTPAGQFAYSGGVWTVTGRMDGTTTAAPGGCVPTDPSCVARNLHTATLLDAPACHPAPSAGLPSWCGKVLVAGGISASSVATRAAELYDPATGAWEPTGDLHDARMEHSATLLPNGKVLVAGGSTMLVGPAGRTVVGSSELYDPTTGSWVPAGTLNQARFDHTATLLTGGTVLVTGGANDQHDLHPVATTEVYDPSQGTNGTWTPAGGMDSCAPDPSCAGRVGHTATRLADGTVLVVGGVADLGAVAGQPDVGVLYPVRSSEVYDPKTARWSATEGLPAGEERAWHTATLLGDGRVLVAGGVNNFALSTGTPPELTASAWLYDPEARLHDPTARLWRATDTMGAAREGHTASLLADGTVLVVGGGQNLNDASAPPALVSAEIFDPTVDGGAGGWTATAPLAEARGGHTATVLDGPACQATVVPPAAPPSWCGAVLVAGGGLAMTFSTATAERYVPSPAVTALSPAEGSPMGGTVVTVDGTGFTGATTISFGDTPGAILSQTPTRIVAVSPAHVPGLATVSVSAAGGTSLTVDPNPAAVFAYNDGVCPPPPTVGAGQVGFGAGYSLIGLPAGTVVGADSPLYGWVDAGAGGSYRVGDARSAMTAGQGYFAWFACGHTVTLSGGGATHLRVHLGAYHASMVGNPSAGPVSVSGFDYAARWDPAMNAGGGGYHLSGYRQSQTLAVGEGIWVFSYRAATISIDG